MTVIPIVETILRDAYKCVQNGYESDNSINVMIVIEDGADEQEFNEEPRDVLRLSISSPFRQQLANFDAAP